MAEHELKVVPPYFDALVSGSKTFEVRKNDRAYQAGDVLRLREWHVGTGYSARCDQDGCNEPGLRDHWAECRETVVKRVTFVYSGDPRFGGVEPGYVVLGLGPVRAAVSAPSPVAARDDDGSGT